MRHWSLQRKKAKPGEAVIRFGDWRKREPTVLMDARQWASHGKPETISVSLDAVAITHLEKAAATS